MSSSKIELKIGLVEFSGEGEQEWLSTQLDKIISKVPELLKFDIGNPLRFSEHPIDKSLDTPVIQSINKTNLSSWLKEKGATTNQVKKFLATAAFIQLSGKHRLSTADVVAALKNSNQSKLSNPADNLNKNVTKGFCEKDGTEFFVTVEGLEDLSIK